MVKLNKLVFSRPGILVSALAALAAVVTVVPAQAQQSGTAGSDVVSWQEDLAAPGAELTNIQHRGPVISVNDPAIHPASAAIPRGYGAALLPPTTLAAPVDKVTANLNASVPIGAEATVDIREKSQDGHWSQWQELANQTATSLTEAASTLQVRITLWNNAAQVSPAVSALSLTGRKATQAAVTPQSVNTQVYRIYATREGLVGGTTANGHVIQSSDHFVALPSGRGLSPRNGTVFSVKVCGPVRCETAPVWDIGPWNTKDDYWDGRDIRQEFGDLPLGTPEAQAAYQQGYNGGRDEFGRKVGNPAGIDLADGTFYNVGLNDNGYVTVTYLWTR